MYNKETKTSPHSSFPKSPVSPTLRLVLTKEVETRPTCFPEDHLRLSLISTGEMKLLHTKAIILSVKKI